MKLSSIDWGDDSAERDPNLLNYFVQPCDFERLLNLQKTFIIGRKGSGKSAIRKKLIELFEQKNGHLTAETIPTFNVIKTIRDNEEIKSRFGEEIFFQYVWLSHLYRTIFLKIGSDSSGKLTSGSLEKARDFAVSNHVTNNDLIETVTSILKKIKIKAGSIGELGLDIEKELKKAAEIEQYEFHLKEITNSGLRCIILVDDLDLGWNNSNISNMMLLGLLSASNHIRAISNNLRVLIFMRSDIYHILMQQTQHSDKYRDIYQVIWEQQELNEIINERIRHSFKSNNTELTHDLFHQVFPKTIGTHNTLNWMIERTLGRPRELLQLAKLYTENNKSNFPDAEILKKVELTYSNWKLDDLATENRYQYPKLKEIFDYWKSHFDRSKYSQPYEEFEYKLMELIDYCNIKEDWFLKIKRENSPMQLAKIFYDIGLIGDFVLGGAGGSRTIYCNESYKPKLEQINVHPCFRKALNTVERIRKKKSEQSH